MQPVHVVLLLLSGALGGVLIMRAVHQTRPSAPSPAAQVRMPASVSDTGPQPTPRAPQPLRPLPRKPSAFQSATPPPSPTIAPPPAIAEPEYVTPAPPAPQPHQVTLNTGLLLPVRLAESLSSARAAPGDPFTATLDQELVVDGFVIARRGSRVEGRVIAADRGRSGALALELTRLLTADGQSVPIETGSYFRHTEVGREDTAGRIGGGAVPGAIAGGGVALATRGTPVELPSESPVTFQLKTPVVLTEKRR